MSLCQIHFLPTSHCVSIHKKRSTLASFQILIWRRSTYILFIDVTNKHVFRLFKEGEKEKQKVYIIRNVPFLVCICIYLYVVYSICTVIIQSTHILNLDISIVYLSTFFSHFENKKYFLLIRIVSRAENSSLRI